MQYEVFYRDREYDGWTADVVVAVDAKAAFYARWASWHPWNEYAQRQVRLIAPAANTGSIQNVRS
jgi:hypothetical protein